MQDPQPTILSLDVGDVLLGRYRLETVLGRGGMGIVWKAHDLHLDKPVAIKLLPPELVHDARSLDRLKAEARRGQSLAHPAIVTLHDFQQDPVRGNAAFLVMEYVPGRTLSDLLREHPGGLPPDRVLRWARQLGAGVDFAHAKGILHRDIKPGNVIINEEDNARLIDFGVGREIRNTMSEVSVRTDSSGTPAYMSPQQLMGENHPSNDIYSLAATLYEALCGRPPFHEGHIQTQILQKPASAIEGLPDHVNVALLRGLAKEPDRRPASGADLARRMAAPSPPPTPPRKPAPATAATSPSRPRRRQAWRGWLIAAVLVLAAVGGTIAVYQINQSRLAEEARQREVERLTEEERQAGARAAEDAQRNATARHTPAPQLSSPSLSRHLDRKTVEIAQGVSAEFVYIDAPTVAPDGFLMGSPASERDRNDDEVQHRVKLTRGYWMQTTQVTQEQWTAVMGSNPSLFKKGGNYPVEQVSWDDCQQFIGRLRQRGIAARLPTEAEWEFACRAGTTTPFSFGNTISTSQANYDGNSTYGNGRKGEYRQQTTPVGTFSANAWGLRDMHGNVWEWCQDWYGPYPSGSTTDPTGPQTGSNRVLRGGSWYDRPRLLRSAYRYLNSPTDRDDSSGFRLTLDSE